MREPYPLRPVTEAEFAPWARMIADTYGADRCEQEITGQRAATELDRTLAAFDSGTPIAGASIYRRALTVPGAVLPVAGIASVGVAPTHRRRGILTSIMRRQFTELHEQRREPVAVLRPSEAGIYGRYGYGPATRGDQIRCLRRSMVFRDGVDSGCGQVRLCHREQARARIEEVYERASAATVGWPRRTGAHWDVRLFDQPQARGAASTLRFALHHEPDGEVSGYVLYRHAVDPDASAVVQVVELAAVSRQAHAALWRFLAGIDLVRWIDCEVAVDDPLPHLLVDPRAVVSAPVDRLWVRLVDVDRALGARRYAVPLDVVLEVTDRFCPWNEGRYRLRAGTDGVACTRTEDPADLRMSSAELAAAFLGGTRLASLGAAGLVEERSPGALRLTSAAFAWDREPFYPGGWAFPLY